MLQLFLFSLITFIFLTNPNGNIIIVLFFQTFFNFEYQILKIFILYKDTKKAIPIEDYGMVQLINFISILTGLILLTINFINNSHNFDSRMSILCVLTNLIVRIFVDIIKSKNSHLEAMKRLSNVNQNQNKV
jgi:hypothetical protein